jgi:hypothetical protein
MAMGELSGWGRRAPGRAGVGLRRLAALWSGFPRTMRAGIGVVWIGFLADTVAHSTAGPIPTGGFTTFQHLAHAIGIAGMVLTLVGIAFQHPRGR